MPRRVRGKQQLLRMNATERGDRNGMGGTKKLLQSNEHQAQGFFEDQVGGSSS